jgi:hypothetical protein
MASRAGQDSLTRSDADPLSRHLTPVGAEQSGNQGGTIPAWNGEADEPLPGWAPGKVRSRYWKDKDEKRLLTIDASNVDKLADKLTPGQVELVKQIKGYRMDVYPSHRNCVIPPQAVEKTKRNALEARLAPDGYSLAHAIAGGVPFPLPQNGTQVMWNHKLRISGLGFEFTNGGSILSPLQGSNDFVFFSWELVQYFPWGDKDARNVEGNGDIEFYTYFKYSAPAALAGQAAIAISYLNKPAENYYYFPGQRRVRRLPYYAYDAPLIGFENEYMVDTQNMFWSQLGRFDYKLVGKKDIYIPHDAFHMYDFNVRFSDAYQRDFINPDLRRYELHRVWVVQATLKKGMRHITPQRTYYLDEDTWNILIAEDRDASGKLWYVREAWQIPVWELGGVCTYNPFVQYNLHSGRYLADYSVLGQDSDVRWVTQSSDPHFSASFYTPDNLLQAM